METTVGSWAFNECKKLKSVNLPDGTISIGDSAFRECSALAVAELPDTVQTISGSAFMRCTSLKSRNLKNGTYIGAWACYGCSELGLDIVLQGSGGELHGRSFANCPKLENVYCPDSTVIVDEFGAFGGSSVKLIITADTGAVADSFAEHGRASGIRELEICEGVKSVGSRAFKISELEKVTFHEDIASIGAEAFYESKRLTTVVMPERVTAEELTMGNAAFSQCSALTEIRLPIGTKTVGTWAFNKCTALTAAYIPEGVETIGDSAFRECSALAVAELPDTVKTVDSSAFLRCAALKSINLKNVTYIGEWGFDGCSELGPDIVLQGSGVELHGRSFTDCPKLENVYCPDSAVIVDEFGAFSGSGVKLIITADTGAIADSFAEHGRASGIKELEICEGVKSVGSKAFKISELEKVIFHEDIASIGADAFNESRKLTTVVMPERVTAEELTMGNAAFSQCSALTEIRLPIGTKTVGTWAFNKCTALTAAYIPEGVETIGDSAFRECSALAVAELPDTVKTVDSSAFLRCAALKSINLKNVTCIGEWGFQGCSELGPDIVLQGSGVTLSRNAFANCPKLENVYCPDSAVIVGDFGAFSGSGVKLIITADTGAVADSFAEHAKASGIRELELCEGVKSVGSRAFKLSELEKVTFHEDIASIGADAFSESQRLVEIVFLGGAPSIDAYSFGKVVADCYYPAEYGSWNSSTMLDYGGTLTWIGQVCGTVTVAVGFSGDGQMLVLREVSSVDDPAIAAMEGDEVWVFFYDAATFAPVRTAHQVR